jgi:hypothetical protein
LPADALAGPVAYIRTAHVMNYRDAPVLSLVITWH